MIQPRVVLVHKIQLSISPSSTVELQVRRTSTTNKYRPIDTPIKCYLGNAFVLDLRRVLKTAVNHRPEQLGLQQEVTESGRVDTHVVTFFGTPRRPVFARRGIIPYTLRIYQRLLVLLVVEEFLLAFVF